jgi:hypothetical protein
MSRCFNASAALHNADQIAKKAPGPVCLIFQSTVRDVRASPEDEMQSAFTPFVACCRQNYGEVQGAVDNRKTSCLSKVLEDGRFGPSAKAIAAGKRKCGVR